ncbi:MAG: methyltransferase domain-containing protein, partial [Deltaproteobacteria bacterium]|nr:methyltransferase domain-containing protein [Deltaproteobacteria bacterium]
MAARRKQSSISCPVCGERNIFEFLEIPQVPVLCNVLYRTREAALSAPRGDIRLGLCRTCGHMFNRAFDPSVLAYTPDYENTLHFSPRFQAYAEKQAIRLIDTYGIKNKDIIDIGCGTGEFLELLRRLGNNRGMGFEPRGAAGPGSAEVDIKIIPDVYSERYAHIPADLVCCRHVLEHVSDPVNFLKAIGRAIQEKDGAVLFLEVPDAERMLAEGAVWDVIYEHYSYFTGHSMAYLLKRCGFRLARIAEAFEGQYITAEAVFAPRPEEKASAPEINTNEVERVATRFAETHEAKIHVMRSELDELKTQGKKAVVWGAGSKGVGFLNALGGDGRIEYAVDVNKRKQGMYIAGAGQKIVRPEFLKDYCPDIILMMNPVYEDEIKQHLAELGLSIRLLAP